MNHAEKNGRPLALVLVDWLIDFINFIEMPDFTYPVPWNVLITVGIAVVFTAYGLYVMLQKNRMRVLHA